MKRKDLVKSANLKKNTRKATLFGFMVIVALLIVRMQRRKKMTDRDRLIDKQRKEDEGK